jgi:hypothetical protein
LPLDRAHVAAHPGWRRHRPAQAGVQADVQQEPSAACESHAAKITVQGQAVAIGARDSGRDRFDLTARLGFGYLHWFAARLSWPCARSGTQPMAVRNTHTPRAWSTVLATGLLCACSNDGSNGSSDVAAKTDASVNDTPAITDATPELQPGQACIPGSAKGCATANHVLRCNAEGLGYDNELCADDIGAWTPCFNPGRCAKCNPGIKRCNPKIDTIAEECTNEGEWKIIKECNSAKGELCVANGECMEACTYNAKAKSYTGCSFFALDLDNAFVPGGKRQYYDAAGAQYAVVVSNASDSLSSKVEIDTVEGKVEFDSALATLDYSPLGPLDLRVFNLPRRDVNATGISWNSYRVKSSAPIAAYQFNPLENVNVFSNDASLLLPTELLGDWYIVMSREQSFDILRGFVAVAATHPGTTQVTLTFSKTTTKTLPSSDEGSADYIKSYKAGESATFTLKQWQVLNIETDAVGADLTGTVVLASQPVAVFAGSEAANAPNTNHCLTDKCTAKQIQNSDKCGVCEWDKKTACGNNGHCSAFITCCADHLEMQQFPVKVWGSHYVGVKLFPRGLEADSWRILAAADGTKVALVPPQKDPKGNPINIPVLDAGEWYEFEADCGPGYKQNPDPKVCTGGSFEIAAQFDDGKPAPIMVGHFMQSQDAPDPNVGGSAQQGDAGTGDPAYLLAIPTDQWRSEFVFLAPGKYAFSYISIAAPADAEVVVDDALVPPDAWKGISANYKQARMFVQPGTHKVISKPKNGGERRVAVDVYGFDQYVSYGYPAGLDLKDLDLIKRPGMGK